MPGPCGGMAERLKAHVLKTCLGHTNVGSNPTPSAIQPVVTTFLTPSLRTGAVVHKKSDYVRLIGEVPEWSNGAAC